MHNRLPIQPTRQPGRLDGRAESLIFPYQSAVGVGPCSRGDTQSTLRRLAHTPTQRTLGRWVGAWLRSPRRSAGSPGWRSTLRLSEPHLPPSTCTDRPARQARDRALFLQCLASSGTPGCWVHKSRPRRGAARAFVSLIHCPTVPATPRKKARYRHSLTRG